MVAALVVILVVLIAAGLVTVGRSLRVVQQYERALIFRFGAGGHLASHMPSAIALPLPRVIPAHHQSRNSIKK